jgi:hypothetical protein
VRWEQGSFVFGVECGSALLCRFGFSFRVLFGQSPAVHRTQTGKTKVAEQSTGALQVRRPKQKNRETKAAEQSRRRQATAAVGNGLSLPNEVANAAPWHSAPTSQADPKDSQG